MRLSNEKESLTKQPMSESDIDLQFLTQSLRKYLPDAACKFVCTQIRMNRLPKRGRKWIHSEKSFALSLYHASKKAYSLLQKLFVLPSSRTLSRSMHNLNIQPGFNVNIMDLFKIKVNSIADQEKLSAILVDEMAIKKFLNYNPTYDIVEGLEDFGSLGKTGQFADHALVFMLRGLTKKWKQSIANFLSSGPTKVHVLQHLVIESVRQERALGLKPKLVIWDQGSNNRAVTQRLGMTSQDPYFFVDGEKIFLVFDPPHLIKNVRNNLKKYGFTVSGEIVSWSHIEEFYKQDSATPIRFATKLTKKHITLPPFANLSVKLATQVLSHTVAAGISAMVKQKSLPEEAFATARYNPDCREFKTAYRQTIVDAILVAGEGTNCQEDVDSFLFSLELISSHGAPSAIKIEQDVPRGLQPLLSGQNPISCLNVKEMNILTYIGGYVANKMVTAVCEGCQSKSTEEIDPGNQEHGYIVEKLYSQNMEKGLTAPSRNLQQVLAVAEKVFRDSITSLTVISGIRLKLVQKMVDATKHIDLLCPRRKCQLAFLALLLYTNVLLHFHIKCLNRKETGENQKLMVKKKAIAFRHQ
ncbi:transposable element p transposase [Plakobranchus ocellatus]|uniref:Transposable element p transposase n=1 Tax=Plakobranchus ocellatus TaxID=259542 RepID=A0AAV3YKK0_9GAST|nr:transposable element p transposase [Plakobranchus ocellatus]